MKLAGQMAESDFEDRPWLLEREGEGYVRATPILRCIAEQRIGKQTLHQIAAKDSADIEQRLSADSVAPIIATRLIARGW